MTVDEWNRVRLAIALFCAAFGILAATFGGWFVGIALGFALLWIAASGLTVRQAKKEEAEK